MGVGDATNGSAATVDIYSGRVGRARPAKGRDRLDRGEGPAKTAAARARKGDSRADNGKSFISIEKAEEAVGEERGAAGFGAGGGKGVGRNPDDR